VAEAACHGANVDTGVDQLSRRVVAEFVQGCLDAQLLSELADLGSLTPQAARFLEASVVAGLNIVVSGGTQAGKTTIVNCANTRARGSPQTN
jgi:pilus assembly protein CpaF